MSWTEAFTGKTVLITGAAGFIAGHLARALSFVPCGLVLVDKFPIPALAGASAAIETWQIDISGGDFVGALAERRFDFVFHFAGNANVHNSVLAPRQDFDINAVATVAMLEAMREAKQSGKFIFASSASVYGNPRRLPADENDPTQPISPYGVSKLAAERYVDVYCKLYGLRGVSLRMFSPFGPGLRKQIIFDLTRKLIRDPRRIDVLGDGSQTRDFIYIDDVVSATLCIATRGKSHGDVYNVGTGTETSVAEVVGKLVNLVGRDTQVRYTGSQNQGYADHWRSNVDRLAALGWKPAFPLEQGLRQTVEWIARENSEH
jgi:nucleoside-diphosphate-sugar epimerase